MALDYSLYIDSDLPPRETAEIVVAAVSPGGLVEADPGTDQYLASPDGGPLIVVMDDSPPPDDPGEIAQFAERTETVGFPPRLWVAYRVRNEADFDPQVTAMLAGSLAVLRHTTGDARLAYEEDVVWLRRVDGELRLSPDHQEWTSERLALLPDSYVMDETLREP